jgi:excisionase family DNA binding protein
MESKRLTLTIEETAKLLGIGRQLAYDRAKTGEIPVIKVGRRLLVPRRALEKLLEEPKPLNSGEDRNR